jgi:15-cis-phytoene synthase
MNISEQQKQSDFRYCEAIIRKHSKSFYYAFSKLPREKANAVFAIYAFCRIADDCVDENGTQIKKLRALEQLKKELDLFKIGAEYDVPLWRALRSVFNEYKMVIDPFYHQLTGQWMDVDFSAPKKMEDLEEYSYYVAGSVGRMLLPIIGSHSHLDLSGPAVDLGIAMQITNILRDVGEDYYEKGRIYLPEEEMIRYQYSSSDLHKGIVNRNFIQLWEKLASRAETLYNRFFENIDLFDLDSRQPVFLSAQIYREILNSVRTNHYNCLSWRNYVVEEKMIAISEAGYHSS